MRLVYTNGEEYHLKIKSGDVGRYIILCGDPGRCGKVAAYIDQPEQVSSNREYTVITGRLLDEKVSVCSTGIGGPSASIALEELVHCGGDTFIRVGTSGGMAEDVLSGDLVIGTAAVRMEGTTREYAPEEYPAVADFHVARALYEAAEELGLRYHMGVLHCKDSFYGQHAPQDMPVGHMLRDKWDACVKCGALASEMETAALYIVGAVRRVRVGSVMLVMANQTRRELGLSDEVTYDTDNAIRTAVDAMKKLILRDREAAGKRL